MLPWQQSAVPGGNYYYYVVYSSRLSGVAITESEFVTLGSSRNPVVLAEWHLNRWSRGRRGRRGMSIISILEMRGGLSFSRPSSLIPSQ